MDAKGCVPHGLECSFSSASDAASYVYPVSKIMNLLIVHLLDELAHQTNYTSTRTDTTFACAQLGYRFSHVLRRMLPIAMYLLQKEGAFLTGHDLFLKRVGAAYHAFLEDAEARLP